MYYTKSSQKIPTSKSIECLISTPLHIDGQFVIIRIQVYTDSQAIHSRIGIALIGQINKGIIQYWGKPSFIIMVE
jgi:hypothetical protein